MLRTLLASALFAGLIAGLFAAALQLAFLVPLISEAELYESGAVTHFAEAQDHSAAACHDQPSDENGAAGGGLTRHLLPVLMTVLTTCGFALILVAGFAHSELMHDAAHDTRHSVGFPCY